MSGPFPDLAALRDSIDQGGKRLLSRALSRIEIEASDPVTAAFLDLMAANARGHVLGLTGPPGVGKSTLSDALIKSFRANGDSVGVLAIDPSSPVTGGALLGDRTRLRTDPDDRKIFVRSSAARDRLGGLSDHAVATIAVMRAVFDRVIVETVGIGQSEGDLRRAADTVLLCIQPGSGDSLQFMKAGIMELPDVIAVTKADMGPAARRAASDVSGALSLTRTGPQDWTVPVCLVSSQSGAGLEELMNRAATHHAYLTRTGRLARQRAEQHEAWFEDMVRCEFGNAGLRAVASSAMSVTAGANPFTAYADFKRGFECRLVV